MKFELRQHKELPGIPSASGLEITDSGIFIIGDDSPYLFKLNSQFEIIEKIQLFPEKQFPGNIIEKLKKPDLEALARGNTEANILYAFGSGSKSPERDLMVKIDLSAKISSTYSLVHFYSHLRTLTGITAEQLNIEAAEIYQEQLLLFNRGENMIIKLSLRGFLAHLKDGGEIPELEIFRIDLPNINGIPAGFSGASLDPDNGILFFTATVENTDNWIDDGEVMGSFIGTIKLLDLRDGMKPDHVAILVDKDHLKIKVESIAVLAPFKKEKADLVLITDSDGGVSEILSGILYY